MDTKAPSDDEWRSFFLEPDVNRYFAKSILLATHQSIQLLEESGIVTATIARTKYAHLSDLLSTDVSEAFNIAYWTYETANSSEPKGLVATLGMAKQTVGSHDKRLTMQINAQYLRWRELLPLVRSLKEIRNTAVHELSREADVSWIAYVSACVLRFSFLSAAPRNDELTIARVRERAINLIRQSVQTSAGEVPNVREDHKSDFERIHEKLASIQSSLTGLPPLVLRETTSSRNTDEQLEANTADENPTISKIGFLTESILKNKLLELKDQIREKMISSEEYSPSENILQTAIINEILSKKVSRIEDALILPDVEWRIKSRMAKIEMQMEMYSAEINDMLERTAWDPKEE